MAKVEEVTKRALVMKVPHRIIYTNWRGETAPRTIIPINMWYGKTEYHPESQWLMTALDKDKNQIRDFAVKDIIPNW